MDQVGKNLDEEMLDRAAHKGTWEMPVAFIRAALLALDVATSSCFIVSQYTLS
jgi:hypothetical protein